MVNYIAHEVGITVFQNRRRYRRFHATIQHARGKHARGIHHIGVAGHRFHGFLHTFKLANGAPELFAYSGIGAGGQAGHFAGAGAQCWKRDGASN